MKANNTGEPRRSACDTGRHGNDGGAETDMHGLARTLGTKRDSQVVHGSVDFLDPTLVVMSKHIFKRHGYTFDDGDDDDIHTETQLHDALNTLPVEKKQEILKDCMKMANRINGMIEVLQTSMMKPGQRKDDALHADNDNTNDLP